MIIAGLQPIEDASEAAAAANIAVFAAEVRDRAAEDGVVRGYTPSVGELVRAPEQDENGWYAWMLPVNARSVLIKMPGVDMSRLRDLSASAPLVRVNSDWWWWNDAVGSAVPLPEPSPGS